jgi:hypothetical protein
MLFTIDSYISTWRKESDICINLAGKVPPGGLDYKPTAGQRSTLELMRYVSYGPYNGVHRVLAGDWAAGRPTAEMMAMMAASDFTARMRWQADAVARELRAVPESDLLQKEMTFPWGETVKRAEALLTPMRWLIGYKMQLFLYLKSAGNTQLGTAECWRPGPVSAA